MLDAKFIRENHDRVTEGLKAKNSPVEIERFIALDEERRRLIKEIDTLRSEKNKANDEIKALLAEKKDASEKIGQMRKVSVQLGALEPKAKKIKRDYDRMLLTIPNIPHSSVPRGGLAANEIIKENGTPAEFDFAPADHITLAEQLGIIDFKRAARLSGSHFALFTGTGARLVRALVSFMLDVHTKKHGYTEVSPPYLVNRASMTATGQLPNLEEDMYHVDGDDLFLIPTAEVPVTNIHRDEILKEEELPLCYTAYTACFRREAGSYGKDTRGLMRVHQFDKVELVKLTRPDTSYQELESLLSDACEIIEQLEIPYRVVLLASGEMSFASAKCYDIEIYAPGIRRWLEVSSCSNFEDFQARRGNIKYRDAKTKKTQYVHTLNGSGVALARLIISILETHQQKDGTVSVPAPLQPYLDGKKRIKK